MVAPVTLYTKAGCAFCAATRRDLEERGVVYREIDVGERPERIPELLKLTRGRRLVPVIVEGARIAIAPAGGSAF
jgi:glutaredoxin